MKRWSKTLLFIPLVLVASTVLAACGKYATPTSDSMLCVYDGSDRGGQRLKEQLFPGDHSKKVDDNDEVVKIPASNRFFMAAKDDGVRDPLAPPFYKAYAAGQVAVQIQGQVRFRFNLEKACEWYSKHGRRNAQDGDLGFNARGGDAANAGWFHFLAENFGVTMNEVASEATSAYDPFAIGFNFPVNADALGVVPQGQQPGAAADLLLGQDLGKRFTDRLNANLGGQYFCGIDPDPNGGTEACPPMRFQVIKVETDPPDLMNQRAEVVNTKASLQNSQLEGALQQQQQAAVVASEKANAAILQAKADSAEAQARIDTAKCRALAAVGDDCDGHRPAGGSVTVTQGK